MTRGKPALTGKDKPLSKIVALELSGVALALVEHAHIDPSHVVSVDLTTESREFVGPSKCVVHFHGEIEYVDPIAELAFIKDTHGI